MFLRSFKVYCRLCGARKSLQLNRGPELLGGFQVGHHAENEGFAKTQERSYSEKNRDPKNFRWVTGRPDDLPRKNRPKMLGRPEGICEKVKQDQEKKPVSKVKASDVTNPEKWTGRPETSCEINQKRPSPPKGKTERTKEGDHEKSKKGPKGGKTNFSGSGNISANDFTKTSSPGMSAIQVGSKKRPVLPEVTSAMLKEVKSLGQRPPPCLEGPRIAKEEDLVEPSSASVFATQFNVAHQGMPEIVSGYARSMKFSEEQNIVKRPDSIKQPISELEKFPELAEVIHASKDQTSPPPTGTAASKTDTGGSSKKFHTIPDVKLSGSSLKNHLLGIQKDSPEKSVGGKRHDIKILRLPPLKIVQETFNEENRHRVYSFGLAETGALGFHKPNEGKRWRKYMARPLRHQFAEENRVISAESGYGFTLFYVRTDNPIKLYGCGINTDFQLGPTDDEVVTYPSPIDLRITSPKTKIVSLSAGRAHSVVATDKEGVFLFGSNSYGQCGRVVEEEESSNGCTITQIKGFGGEKVATVTCGQDHTCFVTDSGKVYACGWGSEGQTGQGHCMHVAEPCLVTGDIGSEKIVKVAGKCDTVLALSDKGNLFGWGSNEFKQLRDDPDIAQVDCPVALEHVHRKCGKITDVAAGSSFCLLLNQEGDVYVWGYGILGAGPELVKTSVPTLLPRTLFGANDYHPLTVPTKVYCGVDHMAVVNNLKHVYAWGKNKHGCLGIGNSRDQYFPYKLAISADAIHVSCAVDHSVVVTNHE